MEMYSLIPVFIGLRNEKKLPTISTNYKRYIFIRTFIEWNQLDEDTVQTKSIDCFRDKIQKTLSLN